MAAKNGFKLLNIPIVDNTAPTTAQMTQFLNYATDPQNQPVYVHCEAGKGRTGVAVACYRMAVEGWTADQAIADGAKYGLGLESQVSFIRDFGNKLDAGQIPGYPVQAQ
jgi:protein tyrosine/serine phosphatase